MWSNYAKVYVFRDCFDKDKVEDNITDIQRLLKIEQHDESFGAFITSDVLSAQVAKSIEAYQSFDDGVWHIVFSNDGKEICTASTWDYKEIQLWFEIEENLNTGKIQIHYCTVKGFKEYQL